MSITFRCPGCSHEVVVKDECAGKTVKCPNCGDPITMPNSISPANPEGIEPVEIVSPSVKRGIIQKVLTDTSPTQKLIILVGGLAVASLCLMPPHKEAIIPLGSGRATTQLVIDFPRLSLWCLGAIVLTGTLLVVINSLANVFGRVAAAFGGKLKKAPVVVGSALRRVAPHARNWWYLYLTPLILLLFLFLWLVWPTPYSYRKDGDSVTRVNRVTQGVRFLYEGEWLIAQDVNKREQDRQRVAAVEAERQKLSAADAERQRLAAVTEADRQRTGAADAERERLAAVVEADRQRVAAADAERQRLAAVAEADRQRAGAADAERQRLAAVAEVDRQRVAAAHAERQRLAAAAAADAERRKVAAADAERQRLAAGQEEKRRKEAVSKVQLEVTGPFVQRFGNAGTVRLSLVPCVFTNNTERTVRRVGFSLIFNGKEYRQADIVFDAYHGGVPGPGQRVNVTIDKPNVPEDADKLDFKVVINSVEFAP